MSTAGAFFARWRVRLSYPLAILVLWFARPTPRSLLWGVPLGLLGLFVRARAAGHLHKQESSHGYRPIRLHAQPALSWQRHSHTRSGGCSALVAVGRDSQCLLSRCFIPSSCVVKKRSFVSITEPHLMSTPMPCRCFCRVCLPQNFLSQAPAHFLLRSTRKTTNTRRLSDSCYCLRYCC